MQKSKLLVAVLGTLVAMPALADSSPFSANVTLTTDYLYRGISQSGHKPAIQGGFDYANPNGLYAGVWGSSISWLGDAFTATGGTAGANQAGLELDTYFGFRNSFATDFNYDVGFLRYNYPGTYPAGATKADTNEVYGLIGYKWVSLKYSYSLGDLFGTAGARGSDYLDLSANYTFDDSGITVGAHYGKQKFKGPNAGVGIGSLTYSDYNVSVSKDFSGYVAKLMYSSTNAAKGPGAAYYWGNPGYDAGKGTAVLSLSRSF